VLGCSRWESWLGKTCYWDLGDLGPLVFRKMLKGGSRQVLGERVVFCTGLSTRESSSEVTQQCAVTVFSPCFG